MARPPVEWDGLNDALASAMLLAMLRRDGPESVFAQLTALGRELEALLEPLSEAERAAAISRAYAEARAATEDFALSLVARDDGEHGAAADAHNIASELEGGGEDGEGWDGEDGEDEE